MSCSCREMPSGRAVYPRLDRRKFGRMTQDMRFWDTRFQETQYQDMQYIDTQYIDTQYIDTQYIDTQYIDTQYIDTQYIGTKDCQVTAHGRRTRTEGPVVRPGHPPPARHHRCRCSQEDHCSPHSHRH